MTTADATALREYVATMPPETTFNDGTIGGIVMRSTADGPVVGLADRHIAVAFELVEVADPKWLGFDAGVFTFRGVNRTVRYRVIGDGRAWLGEAVVCERIEEDDA